MHPPVNRCRIGRGHGEPVVIAAAAWSSAAFAVATIAGERLGLADREVGQHLAVELDARPLQPVDELRIGQAVLAHAGVDALDPQAAEIALLVAPVAIGVAQRLLDLLDARCG